MSLLELDEEQLAIQRTARRFARDVIRPSAGRVDAEARFPLDELHQAWALGLMFVTVPAAFGGAGLDLFTECLIEEEIAWGCAGFTSSWVTGALAIHALARFGTDEQKRRWLTRFTSSFGLGAFALSEPGAGSDIASMIATAERRGDGYVLHGTKQWVTTAGHADVFVVFASVDRKARERGITAFVVERGTPGFEIGRKETLLGIRSSDTHQIHFDGCVIPASQRLGDERQGFQIARSATQHSRPLVACMANGISRAALEHCVRYALDRKINHAPLAGYQATQLKLADMAKQLHASRLMAFDAARRLDRGLDADREASMAKILATDTAMAITTEAVQMFGAYGLTPEYPVEKLFRDAKVLQIIEGTNEVLRLLVAADLVTRTLRERAP